MTLFLEGMHNKESIQELHEAYQVLLKIILANKDRFKKTSKVIYVYEALLSQNHMVFFLGNSSSIEIFQNDDTRENST